MEAADSGFGCSGLEIRQSLIDTPHEWVKLAGLIDWLEGELGDALHAFTRVVT